MILESGLIDLKKIAKIKVAMCVKTMYFSRKTASAFWAEVHYYRLMDTVVKGGSHLFLQKFSFHDVKEGLGQGQSLISPVPWSDSQDAWPFLVCASPIFFFLFIFFLGSEIMSDDPIFHTFGGSIKLFSRLYFLLSQTS